MVFVNAEDIIPESPITQATCDGIKSIEADTVGSQTVSCMVQEGCGTVMCSSPLMPLASNDITFQPCTEVPSIYVEFFNASESADEPVLNQTITQTTTISLTELGLTFIFTITQQANANAILFKVIISGACRLSTDKFFNCLMHDRLMWSLEVFRFRT